MFMVVVIHFANACIHSTTLISGVVFMVADSRYAMSGWRIIRDDGGGFGDTDVQGFRQTKIGGIFHHAHAASNS